jgi:hypothetical protein
MATQSGSTGSRQGRSGEPRSSSRPDAGITAEQQNTAALESPTSRAGESRTGGERRAQSRAAGAADTGAGGGSDHKSGNGSGIAGFVRQAASNRLTQQKDRATRGLGDVARAVRSTTDRLRSDGQETVAGYIEKAADGIDRFSHTLETHDVQEVFDNIQSFARRQPMLFVGTALGIGLVGARFLKSSGRQQDFRRGRMESQGYGRSPDWRAVTAPPAPTTAPTTNRPAGETRG